MLLSCVLWLAGDVGQDAPFLIRCWLGGLVPWSGCRARGGVHRVGFFPAFREPRLELVIDMLEVLLSCAVERPGCCGTLHSKIPPGSSG